MEGIEAHGTLIGTPLLLLGEVELPAGVKAIRERMLGYRRRGLLESGQVLPLQFPKPRVAHLGRGENLRPDTRGACREQSRQPGNPIPMHRSILSLDKVGW